MLLRNGNEDPSIPVYHVVGIRAIYASMELFVKGVNYSLHNWNICGDLNGISILLTLKRRYTKIYASCVFGRAATNVVITL